MKCVQVYVEVTVAEPVDFFPLRVDKCWATQFPQPNASEESVHVLLRHGSEQLSIDGSFQF